MKTPTLDLLGRLDIDALAGLAFSPDGKRLARGRFGMSTTDRLWIHDVERLSEHVLALECETAAYTDGVSCLVWDPHGELLFSGGSRREGAVRVWRTEGAKRDGDDDAFDLYRHGDDVTGIAVSRSGKTVFTTSACYDKAIRAFVARPTVMRGLVDWEQGATWRHWDGAVEIDDLYGFARPRLSPAGDLLAVSRSMKSDPPLHLDIRGPQYAYELVQTMPSRAGLSSWTKDGGAVVCDDAEGHLVRWTLTDQRMQRIRATPSQRRLVHIEVETAERWVLCAYALDLANTRPENEPHVVSWISLANGRVLAEVDLGARPLAFHLSAGGETVLLALANGEIFKAQVSLGL